MRTSSDYDSWWKHYCACDDRKFEQDQFDVHQRNSIDEIENATIGVRTKHYDAWRGMTHTGLHYGCWRDHDHAYENAKFEQDRYDVYKSHRSDMINAATLDVAQDQRDAWWSASSVGLHNSTLCPKKSYHPGNNYDQKSSWENGKVQIFTLRGY